MPSLCFHAQQEVILFNNFFKFIFYLFFNFFIFFSVFFLIKIRVKKIIASYFYAIFTSFQQNAKEKFEKKSQLTNGSGFYVFLIMLMNLNEKIASN